MQQIEDLRKQVDEMVEKTDFNGLWNGFEPVAFAIYDKEKVYLWNHPDNLDDNITFFPWNPQFSGDDLIFYRDYPTAIVSTDHYPVIDCLYPRLMQELFRGYQFLLGEARFPDTWAGFRYPIYLDAIDLKIKERVCLHEACMEEDAAVKEKKIFEFISFRNRRIKLIQEFAAYEFSLETVKGPALYVQFKAHKRCSRNAERPLLNQYTSILFEQGQSLFHLKKSCACSGMLMCFLLDALYRNWQFSFMRSEKSLYDFFCDSLYSLEHRGFSAL
ncbi:hypothetical protein [Bacillus sp. MUM 13]|uniref:hypothetical protein n=1 Tax=Bacillus sp. MUM 13 TaxID=1678001 RepID=UPI0008F5B31F|nr:hypothetical protein [Bacillus sp. MUM 13]OIK14769.1 hypothetical protein BIV59_02190 [Bacillus sp. MUM 13]